jgi:hypothetical protein
MCVETPDDETYEDMNGRLVDGGLVSGINSSLKIFGGGRIIHRVTVNAPGRSRGSLKQATASNRCMYYPSSL